MFVDSHLDQLKAVNKNPVPLGQSISQVLICNEEIDQVDHNRQHLEMQTPYFQWKSMCSASISHKYWMWMWMLGNYIGRSVYPTNTEYG